MSWTCPHQDGDDCRKRKRACEAGAKGCVLEDRFSFPENSIQKEENKSSILGPGDLNILRKRGDKQ